MKKTMFSVCVGKKNGYDVYRVVWEDDGHYVIKWNNKIINVDADINNKNYTYTEYLRAFV